MSTTHIMIKVGKNREILTMFLNVSEGWTTDVIRTCILGKERPRVEAQMIANGKNSLGSSGLDRSKCLASTTFKERKGKGQTCSLKKIATIGKVRR